MILYQFDALHGHTARAALRDERRGQRVHLVLRLREAGSQHSLGFLRLLRVFAVGDVQAPAFALADSLLGEVTEKMAVAVAKADAVRILIPLNKCENLIAGVPNLSTAVLIKDTLAKLSAIINGSND